MTTGSISEDLSWRGPNMPASALKVLFCFVSRFFLWCVLLLINKSGSEGEIKIRHVLWRRYCPSLRGT